MTSSTQISYWEDAIRYTWDSVFGFFYTANAKEFIIVILILIGVVSTVMWAIKNVFPGTRHK